MSLKHGLLGLVSSEGSMTGYELDKYFKNSLNYFWQAKTSQIYRELNAMEDLGWLTSERVIQKEKPNKKVYTITSEGKEELLKWILSPDIGRGSEIKSPFLMRIFFAGEAGEEGRERTLKLLKEGKEKCIAYLDNMNAVLEELYADESNEKYAGHVKYWKITALHGQMFAKYQLDWADKAIAILEEDSNK